ncbi:hypothetical protein [Streptomyces sp. NPDC049040]|uniref:hypothetical protein n=1 Tax=Streptomyces sp. NPDC049040 TaxID=3365593 RepID=UPI0037125664
MVNEEVLLLFGLLVVEAAVYGYAVASWSLSHRGDSSDRAMYVLRAGGAVVVGGIAAGFFAAGYPVSAITETVVAACLGAMFVRGVFRKAVGPRRPPEFHQGQRPRRPPPWIGL